MGGLPNVLKVTEVIDYSEDGLTCSRPADLPTYSTAGVGFLVDGKPVQCGGTDTDANALIRLCLQYDVQTDSWTEVNANGDQQLVRHMLDTQGRNLLKFRH